LDYATLSEARLGVQAVRDAIGVVKVGLELFVREGGAAVQLGRELGLPVFLDLKLYDIPATVEGAVANAIALGARFLTVHAAGGRAMLEAATRQARASNLSVVAVTVITSLDQADLGAQGIAATPAEHALRLARLAWEAGVRSFVCSPAEVGGLRSALGRDAVLITPGIRPSGAQSQDQKRVATPSQAIANGADLLVVGRPIRDAADRESAARSIVAEIEQAQTLRARAQG